MKYQLLPIALLLFAQIVFAQQSGLLIQGAAPKAYVNHTVVAKENWYSVGRIYNISPKEIAPFNGLNMDKGLNPGQVLKIPLTAANFTGEQKAGAGEVLVPVYHIVQEKEGLYRVATNTGVGMGQIKTLNGLSSDALPNGAKLVVGFLKVKEAESSLAAMAVKPGTTVKPPPVEVRDYAEMPGKKETPAGNNPPPPRDYAKMPDDEKAKEAAIKETKQPKAPVKPVQESNPAVEDGGYFKPDFQRMMSYGREMKTTNGQAGVFKTMSGWQDGKYYILMDGVNPGSIVQVTNPAANRTIYAKVLGEMQELRQNNGLLVRISNAAASALGTEAEHFEVTVKY